MGIKGIKKLIESNEDLFLANCELQSTELVIDGPNLLHFLFTTSKDLDFLHGGDYNEFATVTRDFFQTLQSCHVRPLVVMDGGHSIDDRKLKTKKSRTEQRINRIRFQCNFRPHKGRNKPKFEYKCLPILGYDLFLEVLRDMGIEVVASPFEADKEIAAIANDKQCPVLSQDADFYALPITAGFLPIDYLRMKTERKHGKEMSKFLKCKIYHFEKFTSLFPRLGQKVFPLLAILLGNDYTDKEDFQAFVDRISNVLPGSSYHLSLNLENEMQKKIMQWLMQEESFGMAQNRMKTVLGEDIVKKALCVVEDAYSIDKKQEPQCSLSMPEWFMSNHTDCLIPSIFMTIATSHRIFFACQPEDFASPSSYKCSMKIRRVIYSILLKDTGKTTVSEYDRADPTPSSTHTGSSANQHGNNQSLECRAIGIHGNGFPRLADIPDMADEDKRGLLLKVLQAENAFIEFEPDTRFLLAILLYWSKNSFPGINILHVKTLLVCWIFLSVESYVKKADQSLDEHRLDRKRNFDSMMSDLTSEQIKAMFDESKRIRHAKKPQGIRFDILQGFAQFQTCIMAAYDLNSLLNFPFPKHQIQLLFCGRFLHDFYGMLEKERYDIRALLREGSKLGIFYSKVMREFGDDETVFYQRNSQNSGNALQ